MNSAAPLLLALIAAVISSGLAFGGDAAPPPATPPRPAESYDYQLRGASEKLRVFFLAREQLKLVILGDSRGNEGVNPRQFYSGEKVYYPQALNLALDFAGFDTQATMVDDYVLHAPKLKWVVWQLSARLFNKYYQDEAMERLRKSPGYQYDQAHKDTLWAAPPTELFRPKDLWMGATPLTRRDVLNWSVLWRDLEAKSRQPGAPTRVWQLMPAELRRAIHEANTGARLEWSDRTAITRALNRMLQMRHFYRTNEFHGARLPPQAWRLRARGLANLSAREMMQFNRILFDTAFLRTIRESFQSYRAWGWHEDHFAQLDPEEQKQFFATSMNGKFELEPARWQRFEQILGDLAKRNVKVLGFVSPMHHSMAQSPCADDDGTLDPDYWAEMKEFENLQDKYPNFFFHDFHRDGRNEFLDSDYINSDHLNAVGAAKLAAKLVAIQKAIDAQPKLDVTPPEVRSITAVGDRSQVTVVLSETVGAAEAANPANYAIGENIAVLAASLGDDKRTVALKTSPLFEGIGYTLTVGNVKDKMDNVISPKPIPFRFAKTLEIRETSPKNYAWDTLAVGQPRSYAKIPDKYVGLRVLKTAEADIAGTGDAFVSFNVNYPVRVYVAHDAAVKMKPSWMDAFTWTWDSVEVDKDKYRIAYRDFPAGTVTLGGNQGPAGKMYVAFVQPMGAMDASAK